MENIYFLSVDDFDLMIELQLRNTHSFTELLEYAKTCDQRQETKKFIFRQHLQELSQNLFKTRYLNEHFDIIASSCEKKLQLTTTSS